jgi:hypothetical protein
MQEITLPAELLRQQEVVINRYGSVENAMGKLSPTNIQRAITEYSIKSNRQAYLTDSVTISTFGKCYSKNSCFALVELWLFELSEFSGTQNKLTPSQMNQLAPMIYAEAYALNFAELGLFFNRIKTGHYGEFYGAVDPIKIMTFLNQFMNERSISIEKYNNERSQEKKRLDFQTCLNMKITEEQQAEIAEIRNNFIKQMKR